MTTTSEHARRELRSALKFGAVSCLGFITDAALLQLGVHLGLGAAWARVISLLSAMQVTFLVNGLMVFRCLERERIGRQWIGYMLANSLGNTANYFIFVAFVSSRLPVISGHLVALATGSFAAWMVNYVGTRFLVFGKAMTNAGLSDAEATVCGEEAGDEASAPSPVVLKPWSGRRPA